MNDPISCCVVHIHMSMTSTLDGSVLPQLHPSSPGWDLCPNHLALLLKSGSSAVTVIAGDHQAGDHS